jgi:F-box/WD-40 domain protein MET30
VSHEVPASSKEQLEPFGKWRSADSKRSADNELSSSAAKRKYIQDIWKNVENPCVFSRTRPWKDVYKDRFKIGINWKYGRCKTRVFKGHTNGIMCLQFDDSILTTGSYDTTIKIWDIKTGELIRTLEGHRAGVRALQFDDAKLISGSMDRTLKVWNWRTGDCILTLAGHSDGIIGLHFAGHFLASGSSDTTIKIWNFKDKETFVLRGHKDWVNAVRLDFASRTLCSASDDLTIRLWDLDTRKCIKVFEGHCGQVQQVLFLPHEFEYEPADLDGSLSPVALVPDTNMERTNGLSTASLRGIFAGGFTNSPDRALPPRYMLSGGLDNTLRLWDIPSGKCLRGFFGHVEGVWALAADMLHIVSGAGDSMTKIWDPQTGRCERMFAGHSGPVTCVGLSDSMICTGSDDCQARLYSFKPDDEEVG